jgi:hypothetical protein
MLLSLLHELAREFRAVRRLAGILAAAKREAGGQESDDCAGTEQRDSLLVLGHKHSSP